MTQNCFFLILWVSNNLKSISGNHCVSVYLCLSSQLKCFLDCPSLQPCDCHFLPPCCDEQVFLFLFCKGPIQNFVMFIFFNHVHAWQEHVCSKSIVPTNGTFFRQQHQKLGLQSRMSAVPSAFHAAKSSVARSVLNETPTWSNQNCCKPCCLFAHFAAHPACVTFMNFDEPPNFPLTPAFVPRQDEAFDCGFSLAFGIILLNIRTRLKTEVDIRRPCRLPKVKRKYEKEQSKSNSNQQKPKSKNNPKINGVPRTKQTIANQTTN